MSTINAFMICLVVCVVATALQVFVMISIGIPSGTIYILSGITFLIDLFSMVYILVLHDLLNRT
jgi:hypothetical protein